MESISYIIGGAIGVLLGYVLFYLFNKAKSVDRKDHDVLTTKFQDSVTAQKIADERYKSQQDLFNALQLKSTEREKEFASFMTRSASLEATLKSTNDRIQEYGESLNREKEMNRNQQAEINLNQRQVAELSAQNVALLERLTAQKSEVLEMQKTAQLQFEKLAQQIFEEKSGKFTETNKHNIEALLKPLSENIESFKKKVEETYDKESKQRFSLEEKVKDLIETTTKVSLEANNLASALKGQVKKQGDWGETILERILESSGLEKGREYFVQESFKDEDGKNFRPDITVRLPDSKMIIIDSKVSMNAYLRYSETDIPEEKELHTIRHLQAVNTHIDQLSAKKYHESENSLDWVIMFIAIEPAYILAVQADPNLWSYAYARKVILINPTSLIATLRIIADMWKIEQQNKNAKAIAEQGTRLYDKFVGFVNTLEDVGKHLNKSQDAYHTALNQLKDGKGNLIRQAQNLAKLGIKSNKALPPTFLSADTDDDEALELPEGEE